MQGQLPTLDPVLTEPDTAKWLSVGVSSLQRWRAQGRGPEFVRISQRRIGYRKSAVERWLASREQVNPPQGNSVTPEGNDRSRPRRAPSLSES
jgi:predicted DNA-binding transcriptional regulator AlpA